MRKVAVLLVAVLVAAPASSAASPPALFAGAEQAGFADWLVFKDRNTAALYFGMGTHSVDSFGEVGTFGAVGTGKCNVERSRNSMSIMCVGIARLKEIAFEDFEFDPLLSSAHLTLAAGGHDHEIDWVGKGVPNVGQSVGGGTGGVYAGAAVGRSARATGHVFGRHLGAGRYSFGALIQGGYAAVMVAGSRMIEFTDDGRVIVRATYRLANRA